MTPPSKTTRQSPAEYLRNGITADHARETERAMKAREVSRGKVDPLDTLPLKPGIIAQTAARFEALWRAIFLMSEYGLDVAHSKVLDVGAGSGYGLNPFLSAGFPLDSLHGIDLFEDRVRLGRSHLPGLNLIHGDATDMRSFFSDGKFDLACEQFCFCHIPSMEAKKKIATEMLRVVKPGGFILIHDWRISSSKRHIYGVPESLIRSLFKVGTVTERLGRFPSQLWPPVGRFISGRLPGLYQMGWDVPGLLGSWITVLRIK